MRAKVVYILAAMVVLSLLFTGCKKAGGEAAEQIKTSEIEQTVTEQTKLQEIEQTEQKRTAEAEQTKSAEANYERETQSETELVTEGDVMDLGKVNETELDKEKMAHGIAEDVDDAADNGDPSAAEATAGMDSIIEERCPAEITAIKADVAYPDVCHETYYSNTCMMERGVSILLPADYNETKRYPVFYILHGIFGDENSFVSDSSNKIKEIVCNMAAEKGIPQPIIVYPNMYATTDPDQKPAMNGDACLPYDNFVNDLVNDLMPYIEDRYCILTGRENTWLAGFSMGGRETIYITLCHPELFGYVCAISPAPGLTATKDMFMTHPGTLTEDEVKYSDSTIVPDVFLICCGTRDSVVGKYPKQYHELLEKNGIDHTWYEITGADHDNNAIRSGIYNLLKQIAN